MSRSFFDSIRQYGKRLLKTKPRETAKGRNRSRRARLELLEPRRLLTYTFAYNPVTQVATAVGTAAVDSLVLEPSGGSLLYSVDGGAFSGNWGGLSVPISSALSVDVTLSSGNGSSITLGTPTGPASTFGGATLNVMAPPNTADAVTIDDSAGTTLASALTPYSINTQPGTISGPGFTYNEAGSAAFEGGITFDGSPVNGDIYNVLSVFRQEPVTINTASSTTSTVNVGSGGTLNVASPLAVFGAGAATTLNINDASDTTHATATLDDLSGNPSAPFEVTGLSTSPIEYGPGVTALNVFGGTSAGGSAGVTYNVNDTQAGTATTITSGTAADTVVLNVAAGTPLAGGVTYNGGAGGATLDVKLAASATLPAGGITFNGNAGATLNGLAVDGNGQNVTYTADGATAGKGTISDGTGTISFTNLTPIDMDGLATATFAAAAGDAPVKVLNGFDFLHGGVNPAIQVVPNGAGTQFESVAFWNDTTVVVDTTANAGSGAVTVDSANNAHNDTNLTITTADPISIAGPVVVTGNVTLTANGATIAESGTGSISAALLTTSSAGGTTLNGGNNVTSFNATNSGAGAGSVVELTDAAAAALTVTGVAQTGGGLVQIVNPNGIAINGGNIAAGTDAVTLTAAAGTITETSPFTITGGLLTTTSQGGTTLNDTNNVTSFNATNSGAGVGSVVELTDAAAAALTVTGVAQTGGGLVQIVNPNGIAINGGNIAAGTDAVTLTAVAGTITETSPATITGGLLTTTSLGGTTLNDANNVTSFNATNNGAGAGSVVELTDAAATALSVTGVAQTGGGLVQIVNPDGIAINGNIAAGTDAVTLTAAAGTITETSPFTITGGLLTTTSQGGTTLNDSNNVTSFNATNSGAGVGSVVELTDAAAAALTVTGVAQTGGGLVQIVNPNGIAINGGNIAAGTDAVTLTAVAGTITETSPATITGGLLTTTSLGGTTLNDANNVTSFNATNSGAGAGSVVELTDAAATALSVTGIAQTGGGLVQIVNPNGIAINGNIAAGTDAVTLTAAAGTITETSPFTITGGLLTTTSQGGTTLNDANNVTRFNATNSGAGAGSVVELTDAAAAALTVTGVAQTGGGLVQIVNPNGIAINGNIAAGTDAVTLTAAAGTITETSPFTITGGLLTTTSQGGTTLNDANNVTSFNATNSGAGAGSVVELTDAAATALSVTGVAQTGGGLVQIVNPNGIAINGNIAAGTDAVTLTATAGTITETSPFTITGGLLTTTSLGGTTLNDANNVTSFTATNAASGNIQFADSGALIIPNNSVINSATNGNSSNGNVQIVSFGGMQIEGTVSALGTVSLKEYTGEIQESLAGLISADLLITQSKTGTILQGANTVLNFIAADDPSTMASSAGIALDNTDALDIQQIIQLPTLGGSVPNIIVQDTGGTEITGTILSGTFNTDLGNVQLTEKSLGIQEAGGQIDADQLVTSSVEGTILNGNNAITSFNATNTTGNDVDLNNNSNALLTITGIDQQNSGNVQVINFGGAATGMGILITGTIADSSGAVVSLKEWNADIKEGPSGVIDTNTLITQSKRGTLLNGANIITGFGAVNNPNGGDVQLTDNSANLYIAGITETGGNVIVINKTGGITLFSADFIDTSGNVTLNAEGAVTLESGSAINAGGSVTLDVGTGNAAATTNLVAGTINSSVQVTVNGSIGSAILEIPLATVSLNGSGLIFNGGSGSPNVLDISSKAGSNVYCAEEENVSSTVSTIYHATAAGSPYDAELAYNNNVEKVEIDDTLGGTDHVAVHVSDLDPAVSTQYWINAAAGQGSTLKVDASKTTVAQEYAIGDFPAGWTVSTLAPALATGSLTWNAAPPAPPTPLPASVQQKFIVNDLALLQYFGGTGGGCVINNTGAINAANATNALMVASLKLTNNNDVTTLIGGQGSSNELLGGAGTSQLIGRGTNDFALDNYTVDPVTPTLFTVSPPTLELLPLANAAVVNNYIYEWPTGLSYVLQQNTAPLGSADFNTNKVIAANDTNGGLTPTEWLSATLESSKQILQQAQGSPVLALLPGCPNETPHA